MHKIELYLCHPGKVTDSGNSGKFLLIFLSKKGAIIRDILYVYQTAYESRTFIAFNQCSLGYIK